MFTVNTRGRRLKIVEINRFRLKTRLTVNYNQLTKNQLVIKRKFYNTYHINIGKLKFNCVHRPTNLKLGRNIIRCDKYQIII